MSVEEDRRDCVVCARVVSGQKREQKLQEQDKHSVHHRNLSVEKLWVRQYLLVEY